MAEQTKKRYQLNTKQKHILLLTYKFRFINIPQLKEYLNLKTLTGLRKRLNILMDLGYIDRYYKSSFKLQGKAAIYSLSKEGIKLLSKDDSLDKTILRLFYKNKSATEAFKQHNIDTLAVYNAIRGVYGSIFDIFTKQETLRLEDLPETKPDLFLRGAKDYFLVLAHDQPSFVTKKQLNSYVSHLDDEGWGDKHYPGLLFILGNSNDEKRFLSYTKKILDDIGIDDDELQVAATTFGTLAKKPYTNSIWRYVANPDKTSSL